MNPSPSTTSTFISSVKLTLGPLNSATDTVTVLGNVVGGAPTGSVTFYVCHTSITGDLHRRPPVPPVALPRTPAWGLADRRGGHLGGLVERLRPDTRWARGASPRSTAGNTTYSGSSDNTSSSNLDADECLLVEPPSNDAITSDPNASARAGFSFSFLVTTSGSPTPALKKKGKLPKGVHFVNNHNGTATLIGDPEPQQGHRRLSPHHPGHLRQGQDQAHRHPGLRLDRDLTGSGPGPRPVRRLLVAELLRIHLDGS